MKFFHFIVCFQFKVTFLFTQTLTIQDNQNPATALPVSFRLLISEFQDGFLSFAMEKRSGHFKFNLDLYRNKLVFIDEKGDTVYIQDDASVKMAHIGDNTFYHDVEKGYFKVLLVGEDISLVSKTSLKEKLTPTSNSGYGNESSGTTASVTVSKIKRERIFERSTNYFLRDRNGKMESAFKHGFIKMFSKREDEILAFIKREKVDFRNEKDVIELFQFCSSP